MSRVEERHHEAAKWRSADAPFAGLRTIAGDPAAARASSSKCPSSAGFNAPEDWQGGRRPTPGPAAVSAQFKIPDEGSCLSNIRRLKPRRAVDPIGDAPAALGSAETSEPTTRSAAETRVLALRLQCTPVPELSKLEIGSRWIMGPDTVRKLLRTHGVDPGPEKGSLVPLTDLLLCEGTSDPLAVWAFATREERTVLQAGLLTLDEWRGQDARRGELHAVTCYRHLNNGQASSIQMGKLHRFRRDLAAAERWLAARQEAGK